MSVIRVGTNDHVAVGGWTKSIGQAAGGAYCKSSRLNALDILERDVLANSSLYSKDAAAKTIARKRSDFMKSSRAGCETVVGKSLKAVADEIQTDKDPELAILDEKNRVNEKYFGGQGRIPPQLKKADCKACNMGAKLKRSKAVTIDL
jgi:hypothetical protein